MSVYLDHDSPTVHMKVEDMNVLQLCWAFGITEGYVEKALLFYEKGQVWRTIIGTAPKVLYYPLNDSNVMDLIHDYEINVKWLQIRGMQNRCCSNKYINHDESIESRADTVSYAVLKTYIKFKLGDEVSVPIGLEF